MDAGIKATAESSTKTTATISASNFELTWRRNITVNCFSNPRTRQRQVLLPGRLNLACQALSLATFQIQKVTPPFSLYLKNTLHSVSTSAWTRPDETRLLVRCHAQP